MKPAECNLIKQGHITFLDRQLLSDLVSLEHPLVKLSDVMDWERFDKKFSPHFNPGRGRPAVSTRVIVGVLYLKHTFNLSDEEVIERIRENVYWQYFCGNRYFETKAVCDSTTLVKWRQRIGELGLEDLLQETLRCALKLKQIKPADLDDVIFDTTVQEKNITFPTDAKLLNRARESVVKVADILGIELRQNYNREGKELVAKYARYAHAKQFKRAQKAKRRLVTILGRVLRDFDRKTANETIPDKLKARTKIARRVLIQHTVDGEKIYSIHEPETECISKGKAHKRYEFGCKASIATTNKSNWIVGARAVHGKPYDGHTLEDSLHQVKRLTGKFPSAAYADKGYRGVSPPDPVTTLYTSGQKRGMNPRRKKKLRRRSAIEPVIGHLKRGHRLGRNFLKGQIGDKNNVILAAIGFNLSKLIAALFVGRFLEQFFSILVV